MCRWQVISVLYITLLCKSSYFILLLHCVCANIVLKFFTMVTVSYYVNPKQKRKDNTFNVKIIITYKRKRKMLPTTFYVTKNDITRSGKIKNQQILYGVNKIIENYRDRISKMGIEYDNKSIDYIVDKLKHPVVECEFFTHVEDLLKDKKQKSRATYKYVSKLVLEFVGTRYLNMKMMDYDFFRRFEKFVSKGRTPGTVNLVMAYLKAIYKSAVIRFNDEGNQVLSPYVLTAYELPKRKETEKRALSIGQIKKLMYAEISDRKLEMARDVYILSFCLMGMNLKDMYECEKPEDGVVRYKRAKTKERRMDGAYMEVVIDDRIKYLVEKYEGTERLFNIHKLFPTYEKFYVFIYLRLKRLSLIIGEKFTIYSARHSFATIAYNECGIDKYLVHQMLNHVDSETRITDVYIKRSFDNINNANRKVLDLLLS